MPEIRAVRQNYTLAARAVLLLPVIDAALRLLPFRRVLSWLPAPAAAAPPAVADARRIAAVIEAVSAGWPWPGHCLRTAIAAYFFITRHGIPARLVIGVARADAPFSAHAWVECGGEPVACAGPSAACAVLWTIDAKPVPRI